MKSVTLAILVLVSAMALAESTPGAPDPQQAVNKEAMTVAELEKAGDAARMVKDYDLAVSYFQAATKKDRKNATLRNKLGLSELKVNQLSAARADFEKAAKLNPKYADALNNVGAVYFVQKNNNAAARYFKKAIALDETRAVFHVNLGAAWFGQNKLDRAIAEYRRALELDPQALEQNSRAGVTAQVTSPEERARYDFMMAKIYAQRGDVEHCLRCLKLAKEEGYHDIGSVYRLEEFSQVRQDARLSEIVPPPVAK